MIVSHRHRLIFLKTRKTAGTSVEIALSRFCGPDDIVTPIGTADEVIRAAAGGVGAQNHRMPLRMARRDELVRWARGERPHLFNHITADRVRTLVGPAVWDGYTKVSIERNPWDAMVSLYHWATRGNEEPISFRAFLDTPRAARLAGNFDIYGIDGRIEADRVMRFESLAEEFAAVTAELGLPGSAELPHAKSAVRPKGDFRPYYDDTTAAVVAQMCARQVKAFGYRFDAP